MKCAEVYLLPHTVYPCHTVHGGSLLSTCMVYKGKSEAEEWLLSVEQSYLASLTVHNRKWFASFFPFMSILRRRQYARTSAKGTIKRRRTRRRRRLNSSKRLFIGRVLWCEHHYLSDYLHNVSIAHSPPILWLNIRLDHRMMPTNDGRWPTCLIKQIDMPTLRMDACRYSSWWLLEIIISLQIHPIARQSSKAERQEQRNMYVHDVENYDGIELWST